jgi:hypothetical protein
MEATYEQEWLDYLSQLQAGPVPSNNPSLSSNLNSTAAPTTSIPPTVPALSLPAQVTSSTNSTSTTSPGGTTFSPTQSESEVVNQAAIQELQSWLVYTGALDKADLTQAASGPLQTTEQTQSGLPGQFHPNTFGYQASLADNTVITTSDLAAVKKAAQPLFGFAPSPAQYAKLLDAPPGSFITVEPFQPSHSTTTTAPSASSGLSFVAINLNTTEVYEASLLVQPHDGTILLQDETNGFYWPTPLSNSLLKAGVNFTALTTPPVFTAPASVMATATTDPLGSLSIGAGNNDKTGLVTDKGTLSLTGPTHSANLDFEPPQPGNNPEIVEVQLADGTVVTTEHYSQLYYWNQGVKPFSTSTQDNVEPFTAQNYAELIGAPPGSEVSVTTSYSHNHPDDTPVYDLSQMLDTNLIIQAEHPLYGSATMTLHPPEWTGEPLSFNLHSSSGWPALNYSNGVAPPPPSTTYPGYGEWGTKDYEAHYWASQHFTQWKQTLSQEERQSCVSYTSEWDYKQINGYLRGEQTLYDGSPLDHNFAQKQIANLDRAFEKAPALPHNLIVYRGERYEFARRFYQAYHNGLLEAAKIERQPLVYRNFLSTTLSQSGFGYEHFASDGDDSTVRLIIKVPASEQAHSAYLSTVSYESERELLFERGSQLYIDDFRQTAQGQLVVECTYATPKQDETGKLTAVEYQQYCANKLGLPLNEYRQLKEEQRQAKLEALALATLTGTAHSQTGATTPKAKTNLNTKTTKSKAKGKGTK